MTNKLPYNFFKIRNGPLKVSDYGSNDYSRIKSQSPKSYMTATRDATTELKTQNDGSTTPISIMNDTGSVIIGTDRPKSGSFRANFNTLIG
jgi:hypothetical protein